MSPHQVAPAPAPIRRGGAGAGGRGASKNKVCCTTRAHLLVKAAGAEAAANMPFDSCLTDAGAWAASSTMGCIKHHGLHQAPWAASSTMGCIKHHGELRPSAWRMCTPRWQISTAFLSLLVVRSGHSGEISLRQDALLLFIARSLPSVPSVPSVHTAAVTLAVLQQYVIWACSHFPSKDSAWCRMPCSAANFGGGGVGVGGVGWGWGGGLIISTW